MCYMFTKLLHDKSMCHVTCIKKIKFDAKYKTFPMIIFIFLHRPQNVSVFNEILQTRSDCEYVNAIFWLNSFNISKYVFWVEGAYAPGS
jgi:hypothetical protein